MRINEGRYQTLYCTIFFCGAPTWPIIMLNETVHKEENTCFGRKATSLTASSSQDINTRNKRNWSDFIASSVPSSHTCFTPANDRKIRELSPTSPRTNAMLNRLYLIMIFFQSSRRFPCTRLLNECCVNFTKIVELQMQRMCIPTNFTRQIWRSNH